MQNPTDILDIQLRILRHTMRVFKDAVRRRTWSCHRMTGECLCGNIKITLRQKDLFTKRNGHLCHCMNCRKASGCVASNNMVVADFYNANVSSMMAALENMHVLSADRKVVILGDMFELGDDSFEEHKNIIEKAKSLGFQRLIFVGKEFYKHKVTVGALL